MNNDESLDLLDLDNGTDVDTLPEVTPFSAPRPRKPWLLLGVGVTIIILATYIIVSTISGDSSSSIEVDLDAPAVIVDENAPLVVGNNAPPAPQPVVVQPTPTPAPAPQPAPVAKPVAQPTPAPVAQPQPTATPGVPVRVVEDRKAVTFNPDKPVAKRPAPAPKKAVAKRPAPRAATQPVAKPKPGAWYVQFSSHSSKALAQRAQKQMTAAHPSLFAGQQFVILAAVLPNGTTTYRLRIEFPTAAAANGFCRNSKSDGQDCYVTK